MNLPPKQLNHSTTIALPYAHMGVFGLHYVGFVEGGVHPSLKGFLGAFIASGKVLTSRFVVNSFKRIKPLFVVKLFLVAQVVSTKFGSLREVYVRQKGGSPLGIDKYEIYYKQFNHALNLAQG